MFATNTDPATADLPRLMQPTLKRKAEEDPDPLLREVARGLLDGSISPQQVWSYSPYAEVLSARAEGFATWYQELTDEDRTTLIRAGQSELDSRQADLDRS